MAAAFHFSHTDQSRRPRSSHKVVVSSPAMDHEVFAFATTRSRSRPYVGGRGTTNPLIMGRALEEQLHVSPHLLRVTTHHLEDYFV